MPNQRHTSTRTVVLVSILVYTLLGSLVIGAVATNTLEAGYRFNGLVQRVRLALDPPPDREILPVIEVTAISKNQAVDSDRSAASEPAPRKVQNTPRPRKKPVDVKLQVDPRRNFASQVTKDWCAVAGTQIVLAMHGIAGNSEQAQRRLAGRIDEWESRRDSHNGGWGPSAMAQALADHGLTGYEIRSYASRQLALRDAAVAIKRTRAPVILLAWRGAHTWVMTGYRAKADPERFPKARITGAYIYDPWYPRVSTIWGPSDPPGAFQDEAEMERNYLRWKRPEGSYANRDGKFLAIVPTIARKEQRTSRDGA
jgi:hypothetical protein